MTAQAYSNQQLYRIAGENYRVLCHFCNMLEEEGYWEDAKKVLHHTSREILDIYVQSLLVCFAVYCNRLTEEEKKFIASLSQTAREAILEEDDQKLKETAEKFQNNPPILFQLLSLRDMEKNSGTSGLFFDAVLNLMLCLAYLNGKREAIATKFFGLYFDKINMFLRNGKNIRQSVDSKYIFKKLCYGDLEKSSVELMASEGDFERYKRIHLFYREEQMQPVQIAEIEQNKGADILTEEKKKIETKDKPEQPKKVLQEQPEGTKEEEQKDAAILNTVHAERLNELLSELNGLVGLREVKKEINSLINLIKVRKMREQYCLPEIEMSYHMVFTGSPGTGKTTIARLVGEIYKELGILSKGTMTETDRSGLVAGYVGQTALKVKEVVEKAVGGVLFIDEAYALASTNGTDFGTEALDTLVKLMEDHRDDLVVIVAGYTEEMKLFLKSNTGLMSRFNRFISFPDYSTEELVNILKGMAEKSGFSLEEGLEKQVEEHLVQLSEKEKAEFGNARGIRNLFESMVVNQANRVIMLPDLSREQLTVMKEEDVPWLTKEMP